MISKPWIEMWLHPRKTVQAIVEFSPNYGLKILSFIYGLASLFSLAQTFSLGFFMGFVPLIILMLILAPFWGYLVFTFVSWVVYQTGRWLQGLATHLQVRSVLAWSHVPITVNLAVWVVFLFIFRETLFQGFPGSYLFKGPMFYLLFFMCLVQLVMSIWALVLYLNGLAQVQGFSMGKAILNLLLTIGFFALGFAVIVFLLLWGSNLPTQMIFSR